MLFRNKTQKNNTALWKVLVLCSFLGLTACKEQNATLGNIAPDFATFDLQGNQKNLKNFDQQSQKVVVFWSVTCGVCIAELQDLQQRLAQSTKPVQLIAINIDNENKDLTEIIQKRQLTLPILRDQLHITAERYQIIGTPTSFILDQENKILAKFEGLIPEDTLAQLF